MCADFKAPSRFNPLNEGATPRSRQAAPLSAALRQLEATQWYPAKDLLDLQMQHLQRLTAGALAHVPFYRQRLDDAGIDGRSIPSPEQWRDIPLLTKSAVQQFAGKLANPRLPTSHKPVQPVRTSGSTATPVEVLGTRVTGLMWDALTLRDHYWHRRDFKGKLASIRHVKGDGADYPEGHAVDSWGRPTVYLHATGPGALLSIRTRTEDQLEWLGRQRADYLLTYPSNALALAEQSLKDGVTLPSLREVRLLGETVSEEVRERCTQAWNVPVTDLYSANEVGYIALQCPEYDHYHIQSENLYVEVLNEQDEPCREDEVGRVVVTSLHNYAMPLVRYEIGDYAQVGGDCPCGRGLPVLQRIMGRTRNMLVLPTGERYWPSIGGWAYRKIAPVMQQQLIQTSLEEIEARLVVERPLTGEEEEQIREKIIEKMQYPFRITLSYPERIERGAGGKFEDFKSLVA